MAGNKFYFKAITRKVKEYTLKVSGFLSYGGWVPFNPADDPEAPGPFIYYALARIRNMLFGIQAILSIKQLGISTKVWFINKFSVATAAYYNLRVSMALSQTVSFVLKIPQLVLSFAPSISMVYNDNSLTIQGTKFINKLVSVYQNTYVEQVAPWVRILLKPNPAGVAYALIANIGLTINAVFRTGDFLLLNNWDGDHLNVLDVQTLADISG